MRKPKPEIEIYCSLEAGAFLKLGRLQPADIRLMLILILIA